jgi:hypothetical protein
MKRLLELPAGFAAVLDPVDGDNLSRGVEFVEDSVIADPAAIVWRSNPWSF